MILEILDKQKPVRERRLNARASAAFGGDQSGIAVDMLDQHFKRGHKPVIAKIRQAPSVRVHFAKALRQTVRRSSLRRPFARLPSEKGAIGQAHSRAIAMPPRGKPAGAAPRREQAGDRRAATIKHLGLRRCLQSAQREKAEIAGLEIQLERNERALVERRQDRRRLSNNGSRPSRGMRVIKSHRRRKRACGHFQLALDFFPTVARSRNAT